MMKISVQSVHFRADAKLVAFVETKISRLNRYFEHAIEAEVYLKLQHTGAKVQEKIAEITLKIPGSVLVDKKTGKNFEAAIIASVETLKRQIIRHKEKISDQQRTEE